MKVSTRLRVWVRRIRPRTRRRRIAKAPAKHYVAHKEAARTLIHERLTVVNEHYGFSYNRVAIRDQKSRWGSCSMKGNLNFSYRLLFLPPHLIDYVIAHELCHLKEFNHSPAFWKLVEERIPLYRAHKEELRRTTVRRGVVVQSGVSGMEHKAEDLLT